MCLALDIAHAHLSIGRYERFLLFQGLMGDGLKGNHKLLRTSFVQVRRNLFGTNTWTSLLDAFDCASMSMIMARWRILAAKEPRLADASTAVRSTRSRGPTGLFFYSLVLSSPIVRCGYAETSPILETEWLGTETGKGLVSYSWCGECSADVSVGQVVSCFAFLSLFLSFFGVLATLPQGDKAGHMVPSSA